MIKKIKKRYLVMIGVLLIFIIMIYLGSSNELEVTYSNIKSSKIKSDIKVVQISDFHNDLYGENQKEIVNPIKKEKPDLILITGDIMYENASIDNTKKLLEQLAKIAKTYYVTGNHEYDDIKLNELFLLLQESNITYLNDQSDIIEIKGNKIVISGLDDYNGDEYWKRTKSTKERLANLEKDKGLLHILLSHRPELAKEYEQFTFDLVYCGHAHGGQVRIPNVIKGLVAPNQGIFPKYTKGVYNLKNNTKMIVSAGLIRNEAPRIYNKPSLVVTSITPQ